MVMDEVTDILSKRREELLNMLETQSQKLLLEKQHQIYGAISEIDLFLQTINYYNQTNREKDIPTIKLVKPVPQNKDLISRIMDVFKVKPR